MAKAPRILHLHSSFDHGGKEDRAVRLMSAMDHKMRHTIVSAVPHAMGARKAISEHVRVDFPQDFPSLQGMPALGRYKQLALAMQGFDLVLTYNWGAMDAVMAHTVFARAYKLPPLIHHEDGFNADEAVRLKRKRNWFRSIALSTAHALVVPSQRLENIARTIWKQPASKVHRIPNGISVPLYRKQPKPNAIAGLDMREGELVIGTLAGLRPVKNLPLLVRTVAASAHRQRLRLVIVGDGPEKAAIQAEAERLGVADRLMMPGFLPKPERYVGLFDIFALTSHSEQFPISLVEAMAAGKPALATDVGDIKAMVAPVNRPFIVADHSAAALSQALDMLVADDALRQAIGQENRALAAAEYSTTKMFARYAALYNTASGRLLLPVKSA